VVVGSKVQTLLHLGTSGHWTFKVQVRGMNWTVGRSFPLTCVLVAVEFGRSPHTRSGLCT